jgi:hypothetical protein
VFPIPISRFLKRTPRRRCPAVTFLGSNVEYELEAAAGAALVIQIYNPQLYENYAEGDKVNAVLDLECVRVLPEGEVAV